MLLEDGEPATESEFVVVQNVAVACVRCKLALLKGWLILRRNFDGISGE